MKTSSLIKSAVAPVQVPRHARGSILGVVLILLLVFTMIGLGLLHLSAFSGMAAGKDASAAQAFWTADAGIQHVRALAAKHNGISFENMGLGSLPLTITGNTLAGSGIPGSYTVTIIRDPDWPADFLVKKYLVTSTGSSQGGAVRVITLRTELWTFANFMHATNWERTPFGQPIYFAQYDVIDGPLYVNDTLNIWHDPRIMQEAISTAPSVNYRGGADEAVFEGGLILNAPPLDFQGLLSSGYIATIKSNAESGGLALTGNFAITFSANGSVTWQSTTTGTALPQTRSLSTMNGAIYVNGDATVQGVLKGNVTLAAENAIFIPEGGAIQYASALSPDPWATNFNPLNVTDMLALMARQKVEVLGQQPVTIHAAIMVTDDAPSPSTELYGFCTEYHDTTLKKGTGNEPPALNFYGSVAQYRRGLIGREPTGTGAPPPPKGFAKKFKYDIRFRDTAPPYYPSSAYQFYSWKQLD